MKVTYDKTAKALYIQLLPDGVSKLAPTEEIVQDTVFLDKTNLGQIYGIEILGVENIEVKE